VIATGFACVHLVCIVFHSVCIVSVFFVLLFDMHMLLYYYITRLT